MIFDLSGENSVTELRNQASFITFHFIYFDVLLYDPVTAEIISGSAHKMYGNSRDTDHLAHDTFKEQNSTSTNPKKFDLPYFRHRNFVQLQ